MPQRLRFIVAYEGTAFGGWQSQTHRNTVQDVLERAFRRVSGHRIRVHGAGRTDAGVHALGQCAHVDLPRQILTPERWVNALNGLLPPTIRVLGCRYVSTKFHARFSAKGKVYRYRIWLGAILPPLEVGRAWHIRTEVDLNTFDSAAKQFIGTHDFAAFAANRGKPETSTVRTIYSARVRRKGPLAGVEFDGDGFLYKMVRLMVGSIVLCAAGKLTLEEVKMQLASGRAVGSRLVAPAEGLFLVRVRYRAGLLAV
jgi:tRNA pseudouridine38-40 synthase